MQLDGPEGHTEEDAEVLFSSGDRGDRSEDS